MSRILETYIAPLKAAAAAYLPGRDEGNYRKISRQWAGPGRKNTECGNIYMIIEENNTSSREGVKKAGFVEVASLYRKGRLKKYYVEEWL